MHALRIISNHYRRPPLLLEGAEPDREGLLPDGAEKFLDGLLPPEGEKFREGVEFPLEGELILEPLEPLGADGLELLLFGVTRFVGLCCGRYPGD